ncbi:MAG: NAD-dependent epimerase/dehydratase family protein [Nodosilinea sp.]
MIENVDALRNKKVLISGGLGFIGSNLARRLVKLGSTVSIVDSLIPEYGGNLYNISDIKDRVEVNISDVRDEYSFKYLIRDQDYLFNLAGQTSHLDSMRSPYIDLDINCRAQLSILESCRHHNPGVRIVFTSTRQIYGKPDYLPVDEKHLLRPVDINGINKMAGEWYHILYNNVYEIRTSALRLINTYGPGMRIKDSRQTFLGTWIRHLIEGTPFEVWGGYQLRDYNYIDDVIDALLITATSDQAIGGVFNLGGHEIISLKDTAKLLVEINGAGNYKLCDFPEDRRKIDIGDYYSDYGLINRVLGWEPITSLALGLRKTIDFYKNNLKEYL